MFLKSMKRKSNLKKTVLVPPDQLEKPTLNMGDAYFQMVVEFDIYQDARRQFEIHKFIHDLDIPRFDPSQVREYMNSVESYFHETNPGNRNGWTWDNITVSNFRRILPEEYLVRIKRVRDALLDLPPVEQKRIGIPVAPDTNYSTFFFVSTFNNEEVDASEPMFLVFNNRGKWSLNGRWTNNDIVIIGSPHEFINHKTKMIEG